MEQTTFSDAEYQRKKRKTCLEVFLERMDRLILWKAPEKKIARHYPKGANSSPSQPVA